MDPNIILWSLFIFETRFFLQDIVSVINEEKNPV